MAVSDLTDVAVNGSPVPDTGIYFQMGALPSPANGGRLNSLSTLSVGEALVLDQKTDDGKANTGNMRGDAAADCNDNGTDYYNAVSLGADFTGYCTLYFIIQR